MAVFSQRPRGYKTGVFLLFVSVGMAMWGVIAPGWVVSDSSLGLTSSVSGGLWFSCQDHFSNCVGNDFSQFDASSYATLILSPVGLALLLCSCCLVVRTNWCVSVLSHRHTADYTAITAGLCLFIACMVYLGDTVRFVVDFPGIHFGPSFFLTLAAAVASGTAGIVLSIYNKPANYSYITPTFAVGPTHTMPTAPQTTYTVQGQTGYQVQPGHQNVYYYGTAGEVGYASYQNQASYPHTAVKGY
ncbi:hypothetical protein V1264_005558 [Littorina saxatilis]|uniref:Uncharacterized protein n=1 Tax=Littorina saxatilis TaxID=31220 RepID=A0AAN9G5L8_9CAEN